jgi:hypothetical protein
MNGTLAALLTAGAIVLAGSRAVGQTMTLGEVLILMPVPAKPAGAPNLHLLQADRGNRKGQMVAVWTGRTADARPPAGDQAAASEYQLLSPSTVGALPAVDVLGIHYIKVRPERREAFERYVRETLHPAVGNLRPDLRLLYYKAVRGPDAGSYITVMALTRASRDKYWPNGADSDDLRAAFKPVQPLTTELLTYLVEGSALTDPKFAAAVFESREWTDFVLVATR